MVDVRISVVAARQLFTSLQDMIGFGTDDLRLEEADRSYYYPPRRCTLTPSKFSIYCNFWDCEDIGLMVKNSAIILALGILTIKVAFIL